MSARVAAWPAIGTKTPRCDRTYQATSTAGSISTAGHDVVDRRRPGTIICRVTVLRIEANSTRTVTVEGSSVVWESSGQIEGLVSALHHRLLRFPCARVRPIPHPRARGRPAIALRARSGRQERSGWPIAS